MKAKVIETGEIVEVNLYCDPYYKEKGQGYDRRGWYEDELEFIRSEKVEKVDLEKEIKEQIDKYYENCNKKLEEMGEDDNDISFLTLDGFARHFYELGLKVKGE